jgi:serine/threonine protein kinase
MIQLPGFEVIEEIGRGGMASVWKARQISLNRIVAIKILHARLAHGSSDVHRFQAEAQAAAKLKHPGIVQVYDASTDQGMYYFVMEYVEGETVGAWCRRKGVLPEKDALQVAECVADALAYAWNKERITHCDIKPDNVMIDSDGTVKVADLGLSRTIHAMTFTQPEEEILGTPAYMSPEQARGDPNVDFRADVYALGAMLYHLVTGKMPFEGKTPEETIELQVTGNLADPIAINPKLSRGVCWLIEKMMWKLPEGRHGSWESVVGDIHLISKHHIPKLIVGAPGSSTVQRSKARQKLTGPARHEMAGTQTERSHSGSVFWFLATIALLLVAVYFFKSYLQQGQLPWRPVQQAQTPEPVKPPSAPPPAQPAGKPNQPVPGADRSEWARQQFEAAVSWIGAHPDQWAKGVNWLRKVAKDTAGTPYSARANEEANRLERERTGSIDSVLSRLRETVEPLRVAGKYEEAIRVVEDYTGPYAAETAARRAEAADQLRRQSQQQYDDQLAKVVEFQRALAAVCSGIADAMLQGSLTGAVARAQTAAGDPRLASRKGDFDRLAGELDQVIRIDEKVLRSFASEIGKEITVALSSGTYKVQVLQVMDGRVDAVENRNVGGAVASKRLVFTAADLTSRERMQRMGAEDDPVAAMAKGLLAWNARTYSVARKCFELADPIVRSPLVAKASAADQASN